MKYLLLILAIVLTAAYPALVLNKKIWEKYSTPLILFAMPAAVVAGMTWVWAGFEWGVL